MRRLLPLGATSGWISYGSPMMSPTVMRGFSEVYGSWKTIWMLRRTVFIDLAESLVMSSPLNVIRPDVGSSRCTSIFATVDLPQPDSPTMPSVSPAARSNETPSTAFTAPTCRRKRTPCVSG